LYYFQFLKTCRISEIEKEEEKTEEPEEKPRRKFYPEGVLVVHRSKRAPRKSVRWRPESELVSFQYFELDENERVNVSRANFGDLKALERNRERESFMFNKLGKK